MERFWSKTTPDPETGCLLWTASVRTKDNGDYGWFWLDDRGHSAHRVAFWLTHGRWPTPCCLHRCDNPSCVNPDHLFEGTFKDNYDDMIAKGRENFCIAAPENVIRGEDQPNHKLTDESVRYIRRALQAGAKKKPLARELGVSPKAIRCVAQGKTWTHVQ